MKSKQEVISWLKSTSQIRVILFEIAGVLVNGTPTNFYLSNRPFTTAPQDLPPSTMYNSIVKGGINFSESINLDGGSPSIGFGDIALDNTNGRIDEWLEYVWVNAQIAIYVGDLSWSRLDYFRIFKGRVRDIDSSGKDTLNLLLVNALQNINTPISDVLLQNSPNSPNALIPVTYGECFNVTPLLVNPPNLEYQVHTGKIEEIIEVRDNGYPVSISKNLNAGKFTLLNSPVGTITASIQGNRYSGLSYSSKIGPVIRDILFPVTGQLPELTLRVDTTTANSVFAIELQGDRSPTVVIEWGNGGGVTSTINGGNSVIYAEPGTYFVKIKGIKFGFKITSGIQYLTNVLEWGTPKLTDLSNAFKGSTISTWSTGEYPDLTECVSLASMFEDCANFNEPTLSGWNISAVTNTSKMFKGASSFNQNIGSWNTSNVTNMSEMFYGASNFDQDITSWIVSNCTNMTGMFQNAAEFNRDLSIWDVFHIPDKPTNFDTNATSWTSFLDPLNRPLWGRTKSQPQFNFTNIKLTGNSEGYHQNLLPYPSTIKSPNIVVSKALSPPVITQPSPVTISSNNTFFNYPITTTVTPIVISGTLTPTFEIRGGYKTTFTFQTPVIWDGPYNFPNVFDTFKSPGEVIVKVNGGWKTGGYPTIWENIGTFFILNASDYLYNTPGSTNTFELYTYYGEP